MSEHSKNFDKVKTYYENYLDGKKKPYWTKDQVHNAVGRWITAEEYQEITGEPYAVSSGIQMNSVSGK